jgi:hypothetical protein
MFLNGYLEKDMYMQQPKYYIQTCTKKLVYKWKIQ